MQINQIDNFSRVASRFIQPIYVADGLGGYKFSSTFTLVKYMFNNDENYHYFIIFAYHATEEINKENAIKNPLHGFYFLDKDDKFISLEEKVKKFIVSEENDIVICKLFVLSKNTNYFNLNFYNTWFFHPIVGKNKIVALKHVENKESFLNDSTLCWIGYPARNSVDFHKTKSKPEKIKETYSIKPDIYGGVKSGSGKYLLIPGIVNFKDDGNNIIGDFNNKNITYFPSNKSVNKGYSLKGMSGGALFVQSKFYQDQINNLELNEIQENYEFIYNFIGIGLEFSEKKGEIKGLSAGKIISLLEKNKSKFYA